ncbi:hypothetical protein ISS06_00505 [Patescibacteria group bacterium]|nr:hypothetical protein [Patescibacteria group bacterium]
MPELNKEKKIESVIKPAPEGLKTSKTESFPIPETETNEQSESVPQAEHPQTPIQSIQPTVPQQPVEVVDKSVRLKKIEDILADGVDLIYDELPNDVKKEFKKQGEETAFKIDEIISKTKIAIYKIIGLIKKWLIIIPGVNKFFLEQETKIKTEKILEFADKYKKE